MHAIKLLLFIAGIYSSALLPAQETKVPVIRFAELEKQLHHHSDTVYIINFWATWCGPCRRELPEFEKIHREFTAAPVKVLLVSLDFPMMLEKGLKPYLINNQITAEVVLLNEPDANAWIDKVDPSWTGSLPATLLYKHNNRKFYEKELVYQDIVDTILSLSNQ